jgi:hypothetical protein
VNRRARLVARRGAVGGADPAALAAAAVADGATPVAGSDVARAHVRRAPPSPARRRGAGDVPAGAARGAPADAFVPTSGAPRPLPAVWAIVEVDTLVTSHDPRTYAPRPEYPAGVQERDYQRDGYERAKVENNASRLVPAYLVNNNPDAVNGAPLVVVDDAGTLVVLGGNSRAMSLALAYDRGGAAAYRATLVERAGLFGFAPADVEPFARPALVRIVDAPRDEWRDLSRALNEALTQSKSGAVDAVSASHRVSDTALAILDSSADDGGTLDAYLQSAAARPLVAQLVNDSVITPQTASLHLRGGELTEEGRAYVARVLVALLVPDAVELDRAGPARRQLLARVAPALVRARRSGHDLGPALLAALADLADAAARGQSVDALDAQGSLFGETLTRARTPEARAVRQLLSQASSRRTVRALRAFGSQAAAEPVGQVGLFGASRTTAEILAAAIAATGDA